MDGAGCIDYSGEKSAAILAKQPRVEYGKSPQIRPGFPRFPLFPRFPSRQ